jgi:hypothetical protein
MKPIKHYFGVSLNIPDWIDYGSLAFGSSKEMNLWLKETTNKYIKKLTSYRGHTTILFHVFPTKVAVETRSGDFVLIESTVGGQCALITLTFIKKFRWVIILYNPYVTSRLCKDCLENVVIHEVSHIEHPNHDENDFMKAYNQAVAEKNGNNTVTPNPNCNCCNQSITDMLNSETK